MSKSSEDGEFLIVPVAVAVSDALALHIDGLRDDLVRLAKTEQSNDIRDTDRHMLADASNKLYEVSSLLRRVVNGWKARPVLSQKI